MGVPRPEQGQATLLSAISFQQSAFSDQLSAISFQQSAF
jgi:hypothetical protein